MKDTYIMISKSFQGPDVLDADMTLDELVSLVARETTLAGNQVEQQILRTVNSLIYIYQPKEDVFEESH